MRDYLASQLGELPYFRALLRAVEARFYDGVTLPRPVLDLGCGDGHLASRAFEAPLDVGLDPWWGQILEAAEKEAYSALVCAGGDQMPFPADHFSSAVSNSVLEHIPDLDPVLAETARVLKPGSPFLFCVPNHRFLETLSVSGLFDRLKLTGLANLYRGFFNRISRHYNCDSYPVWEERLSKAGFVVEDWWDYFPPRSLHLLEWGHYFGLPSWAAKRIFGRWILAPYNWNLILTERVVRPHYQAEPRCPDGVYSFYITRRRAD